MPTSCPDPVGAENPIAWQGSGICLSSSVPGLRLQRAEGRKQVDGTRGGPFPASPWNIRRVLPMQHSSHLTLL
jgi:hypothetical protein